MPPGWPATPTAATRRGWAWPAATSTATGRLDLAVTNFYGESTTSLQATSAAASSPSHTPPSAWPHPSRYLLGFGIAFLDANNDGRLDLPTANGHVNDLRPRYPLRDARPALAGHRRGRTLIDVSDQRRRPLARSTAGPRTGRRRPRQRRPRRPADRRRRTSRWPTSTTGPRAGHFVTLRLEGTASNRDAVGAGVVIVGRRPAPHRLAHRRRQLPVGRRPAAPLRPGQHNRVDRSRCPGPPDGSIASGRSAPTPATCYAREMQRPGHWPATTGRHGALPKKPRDHREVS